MSGQDGILEIIGPVMVGPSSSHTAGALRLARLARAVLGGQPQQATLGLHGSFAKTGAGHGTKLALTAGLLGMAVDDVRLANADALAAAAGLTVCFEVVDLGVAAHPNTVVFDLRTAGGHEAHLVGASLGGGSVQMTEVNGFAVNLSGLLDTMLFAHADWPGVVARLASAMALFDLNIAAMQVSRKGKGGQALTVLELDHPCPEVLCTAIAASPQILWSAKVARIDATGVGQ
jgi:L-serine dehydratase